MEALVYGAAYGVPDVEDHVPDELLMHGNAGAAPRCFSPEVHLPMCQVRGYGVDSDGESASGDHPFDEGHALFGY